jgi:hypothetical protein
MKQIAWFLLVSTAVILTFANSLLADINFACNQFEGRSLQTSYLMPGCGSTNGCKVRVCSKNLGVAATATRSTGHSV